MTQPKDRGRKVKFKRTTKGSKKEYFNEKSQRKKCAVTKKTLSGVSRETKGKISKESKTQRRPSVPFGGILGSEARHGVFIELGKVAAGIKTIDRVDEKYKKYVKQAVRRVE